MSQKGKGVTSVCVCGGEGGRLQHSVAVGSGSTRMYVNRESVLGVVVFVR